MISPASTDGFVNFNSGTAMLTYTARGYQQGVNTDSFGYTLKDAAGDTTTGIVNMTITSSQPNMPTEIAADDDVALTGTSYGQRLIANNAPTFTLTAGGGGNLLFAGSGADTIVAQGYGNTIYGGPGGDTINGGLGTTTIVARDGNNAIGVGGYNDTIIAGNGNNTIAGPIGNASIAVGNGSNTIVALGYNDTITAGSGNNVILGVQGNSAITTGAGDQTIVMFGYGNTVDVGDNGSSPGLLGKLSYINAGDGNATVSAGNGTNIVLAGGYGDNITVGNGMNLIFATGKDGSLTAPNGLPTGYTGTQASEGSCSITLGNGTNWVYLHGWNNTINDGSGNDVVWGGTGNDQFVANASGGVLYVENFSLTNGDTLDLRQLLAGSAFKADLSNLAAFVKVIGHGADDAAFGATADGGTKTVLQITGTHGSEVVNFENSGSISVSDLVTHHAIV